MASIDLAKAFDSVPHCTLLKACRANGLDEESTSFITDIYTGATTELHLNGRKSQPISLNRGVRQGDPLSPMLFNLVIDQLLRRLDTCNIGTKLGNQQLSALAYADDLILCADSREDLHNLLAIANEMLRKLGLTINWNKSFSYSADIGLPIKQAFKYLGANIDTTGNSRMEPEDLLDQIQTLHRGILRGNQKIYFLRFHLIPAVYHRLIHEKAIGKTLEKMSGLIRNTVRCWARLPASTCNSFLHLPMRRGGLGIQDLRRDVPAMTRDRLTRLQQCSTWYIQWLIGTNWYREELTRVTLLCTEENAEKWHRDNLHDISTGFENYAEGGNRFLNRHLSGAGCLKGQQFYRFAQLRALADDHKARQHRTILTCTNCSLGLDATLQHSLMSCHGNTEIITRRHNVVVKILADFLERSGHRVKREFRLPCGLRPDLIVRTPDRKAFALDVTIAYELTAKSLDLAFREKVEKYSPHVEEIRAAADAGTLHFAPSICTLAYGVVFGAKGSVHRQSLTILERHLLIPRSLIERMLAEITRHSIELFIHSPSATRDINFI